MKILSINVATFTPNIHSQGWLYFQARGNVIKNPFWYNLNLKYDFISLELIILEREHTMEAKYLDNVNK